MAAGRCNVENLFVIRNKKCTEYRLFLIPQGLRGLQDFSSIGKKWLEQRPEFVSMLRARTVKNISGKVLKIEVAKKYKPFFPQSGRLMSRAGS